MTSNYFKISCHDIVYSCDEYRNLIEKRIDALANNRIDKGTHAVIKCSSNFESILWMVACFEYRCSFTVLSPKAPNDRNSMIINDCKPQQILGDNLSIDKTGISQQIFSNDRVVYVLYTSGTTGKPKGVIITEKNYQTFVRGMHDYIDFKKNNVFLSSTSLNFDISILETLVALTNNQSVVIMEDNNKARPSNYLEVIEKNKINIVQWTPTLLEWVLKFNDFKKHNLNSVKKIFIGGEKPRETSIARLSVYLNCDIFICYGPTEATIWSMIYKYNSNSKTIYLGKPLFGYSVSLIEYLNTNSSELVVSGNGISPGYLNIPSDNFYLENGKQSYKTGDLVQKFGDGNLVFIGRADRQVKVNGFRVELDEIEIIIEDYCLIDKAYVLSSEINDRVLLKAFVLTAADIRLEDLINSLRLILPEYAIPRLFYLIPEVPININGKVDYKNMNEMYALERYQLK